MDKMSIRERDAHIKAYFESCIDSSGYLPVCERPDSIEGKFAFVLEYYIKEYKHEIVRKGFVPAFAEYLSGLPSTMTIAFYYDEILELAESWGADVSTESKRDKITENYFSFMANKFMKFAKRMHLTNLTDL